MADIIKSRRDTAENRRVANPILAEGELAFETDTKRYKLGDGKKAWNSLSYFDRDVDDEPTQGSGNWITSGGVFPIMKKATENRTLITQNPVFSKSLIMGESEFNIAKCISNVFLIPEDYDGVYYTFCIAKPTALSLYAVDNNKQNREEFNGNFIKHIADIYLENPIVEKGNIKGIISDNNGICYVVIDMTKFKSIVTETIYNLYDWAIDESNYIYNKKTLEKDFCVNYRNLKTIAYDSYYANNKYVSIEKVINDIAAHEINADKIVKQTTLLQKNELGSPQYDYSTFNGWLHEIGHVKSVINSILYPIYNSLRNDNKELTKINIAFVEIKNSEFGKVIYEETFHIDAVKPGEMFYSILEFSKDIDLSPYESVGLRFHTPENYSAFYVDNNVKDSEYTIIKPLYSTI